MGLNKPNCHDTNKFKSFWNIFFFLKGKENIVCFLSSKSPVYVSRISWHRDCTNHLLMAFSFDSPKVVESYIVSLMVLLDEAGSVTTSMKIDILTTVK